MCGVWANEGLMEVISAGANESLCGVGIEFGK